MEMNCLEKHVAARIKEQYKDRIMTIGRCAHVTEEHNGRGPCQYRDQCARGCPFTGYFSSNGVTLPAAAKTGNMTLRPHSIVLEVLYDEGTQKAKGVRIMDAETKEVTEYFAKIIFLNASTLGTTFILLNSVSNRFPNGFGNDSDQVGRNLMDHHFGVGASGTYEGFEDKYVYGRRANGIYIPVSAISAAIRTAKTLCAVTVTRAALRAEGLLRSTVSARNSRKRIQKREPGACGSAHGASICHMKTIPYA